MIMDPRGFGRWRPQVPGNLPPGIYSYVVNLYVWLNTYFFYSKELFLQVLALTHLGHPSQTPYYL